MGIGVNKIKVGKMIKAKWCDLEEKKMEVFIRITRKGFTGLLLSVVFDQRYLVRFEYSSEKDMILDQLTAAKEEKITETE